MIVQLKRMLLAQKRTKYNTESNSNVRSVVRVVTDSNNVNTQTFVGPSSMTPTSVRMTHDQKQQ